MIQLRTYDEGRDYPMVEKWWCRHGVPATPCECVPMLGVIASEGDKDLFAAWVSMDNSCGLCSLLWPVANPDAKPREVARSIRPTVDLLKKITRDLGYHTMMTLTHSRSLTRQFARLGFQPGESPVFATLSPT